MFYLILEKASNFVAEQMLFIHLLDICGQTQLKRHLLYWNLAEKSCITLCFHMFLSKTSTSGWINFFLNTPENSFDLRPRTGLN